MQGIVEHPQMKEKHRFCYWETYVPVVAWLAIRLLMVCILVLNGQLMLVDCMVVSHKTQLSITCETESRPDSVSSLFNCEA